MFRLRAKASAGRRSHVLAVTSLLMGASPAHAADLCGDVSALLAHAQGKFVGPSGAPAPLVPLAGAQSCKLAAAQHGAMAYHCAWAFDYRAAAATEMYQAARQSLTTCFGDRTTIDTDVGVNHPDSYDQQIFRLGTTSVSLSLKDKGALQQTYVFLGIQGPSTP